MLPQVVRLCRKRYMSHAFITACVSVVAEETSFFVAAINFSAAGSEVIQLVQSKDWNIYD
jgi:hypothetical protein